MRFAWGWLAFVAACTDLGGLNAGGSDAPDASLADGGTTTSGDAQSPADAGSLATDAEAGAVVWEDTFDRSDGSNVGNGWIAKNAAAFALQGGMVVRQVNDGLDYLDNILYRPTTEAVADVEASVELKLSANPPGYPQIHVRIQPSSVTTPTTLDSYLLFLKNSTSQAVLARQRGSAQYVTLATLNVTMNTTDRFRLRLSATGTSPVNVTATIERLDNGSWTVLGTTAYGDSDPLRLSGAGTVGISAGKPESTGGYAYDSFRRTSL